MHITDEAIEEAAIAIKRTFSRYMLREETWDGPDSRRRMWEAAPEPLKARYRAEARAALEAGLAAMGIR